MKKGPSSCSDLNFLAGVGAPLLRWLITAPTGRRVLLRSALPGPSVRFCRCSPEAESTEGSSRERSRRSPGFPAPALLGALTATSGRFRLHLPPQVTEPGGTWGDRGCGTEGDPRGTAEPHPQPRGWRVPRGITAIQTPLLPALRIQEVHKVVRGEWKT